MHDDQQRLRQRLAEARQLARQITRLNAGEAAAASDDRTWVGPRPAECHRELTSAARGLDRAVAELRAEVVRLTRLLDLGTGRAG